MTTTGKITPLGYLSDQETKVDLLNNEAIAKTIVRLIDETVDSAVTIGVHGDWGAGKSSVLEMVEAAFPEGGDVLCLKFSGWQFQGFEDAKIALIEGVVNGLIEKRSLATKAAEEVKRILKSVDWLKVAKKGGGLALTAYTGIPMVGLDDLVGSAVDYVKKVVTDKDAREATIKRIEEFKKEKSDETASKRVPTEIREFREAYKELIKKAGIKRLVVLIDDLDRCLPHTAIETLEAIRLFVLWDKTAFIVGADEGMIEIAVRDHFRNLPEIDLSPNNARDSNQNYTRSYLEKLLQVPFRIPALGETETGIYVTLLLLGRALGEDSDEFAKLLALGKAALGKPWEGKGIDHDAIKTAVGKRFDEIVDAMTLADRVSPVLAAGTKGNPRQIKRFLNALALRLAVAEARGFGNAIEQPRLAKVMLAEMFLHPTVFDHIATKAASSEDGICPEIALIEKIAAGGTEPPAAKDEGAATEVGNPVIDEWKTRPDVMRWAAVKPDLGAVSLKPYLFVIKDRKNYLGSAAPLPSKLAALLEKLLGGDMSARGALTDVRSLNLPEAVLLFDALRKKVRETSNFEARPPAISGVTVVVEAHPSLQGRYVDILEALPPDRVGLWVASGHAFVTEAVPKARIEALREKWRKATKNPLLRAELEPKRPARGGRAHGNV
ncbi:MULTISPECIES: Qat anti-phage system ATPase QatA [unclassified Bradyrhizobium]|uniref:Qat anti-phage system ATPase QatA n=1 Tax=unclassified Bradyrhizobium TaxID=2631580 RepID=UPI00291610A5|nr:MULTISPECIES: Qat anti-phage system ATPase QatA [unclassified Bradyrhizobium]